MVIICKSCGKISNLNYKGMCQRCYTYFYINNFDVFEKPKFGEVGYVTDKNSKQYGMPICHICGKAYEKLQQHVYYSHNISKAEYCIQFGLDKKVRLTSPRYNKKMSDYAYKYNMPEQLRRTGIHTRFKRGTGCGKYTRSPMTMKRLKTSGVAVMHKYKNNKVEVN